MYLYLDDTTRMGIGAIVNVAGTNLRRYLGICDTISTVADTEKLEEACRRPGRCRIGQAVAAPDCGLPCRYIIHMVGPGWHGGEPRERFLLVGCYQNTPHKTYLCSYRWVVVPLIFSGDCHMLQVASFQAAGAAIADFCQRHPSMEVTLVLYRQSIYSMTKHIPGWEDVPS